MLKSFRFKTSSPERPQAQAGLGFFCIFLFLRFLPYLAKVSLLAGSLILFTNCGKESQWSGLSYHLKTTYTNDPINELTFTSHDPHYYYMISGEGFTADVPLGEKQALRPSTRLYASEKKTYHLTLTVYQADGTTLLRDHLTWAYGSDTPASPIVSFSEAATSDTQVTLLIATSRDPLTRELWIEGDLSDGELAKGQWYTIPASSSLPLTLSSGDGEKTLRLKMRNLFGNESPLTPLSILLKSQGPRSCAVRLRSLRVPAQATAYALLTADDDGPSYYRITGDLASPPADFKEFKGDAIAAIALRPLDPSDPAGPERKISIFVRDLAENYCPRQDFVVTIDPSYRGYELRLANKTTTTEDEDITLLPQYDALRPERVQMFISGGVLPSATTLQWLPMQSQVGVRLTPLNGNRFVKIQFREEGLPDSEVIHQAIFLRPFILLQGQTPPYGVLVSDIIGLRHLSIEGCEESYEAVAFSPRFTCTPAAGDVRVTYALGGDDGEEVVVRSVAVPPGAAGP